MRSMMSMRAMAASPRAMRLIRSAFSPVAAAIGVEAQPGRLRGGEDHAERPRGESVGHGRIGQQVPR
jgi:hypothetical protein